MIGQSVRKIESEKALIWFPMKKSLICETICGAVFNVCLMTDKYKYNLVNAWSFIREQNVFYAWTILISSLYDEDF